MISQTKLSQDNPLHLSLFPPHEDELLDMSFLLNSSLDIFDIRQRTKTLDQDLGLLHAIDERLAAYGWLTNTGIKFIIVVDMMGKPPTQAEVPIARTVQPVIGLKDAEMKPAFRAIQTAYIGLLMDPFYMPEERSPLQLANQTGQTAEIKSNKFIKEIQRIGKTWYPGITAI